jgi:UDP-N-acetylmuramate--alanine ligase
MTPTKLDKVYFLGIGGIGMSALARYLKATGSQISGYDRVSTPLTEALEKEGMIIHYHDNPLIIAHDIDLVVYTPAIPADLNELQRVKELKLPLMKRSQLLEYITRNYQTLAVAGTHGKTTVSTMLAHIMYSSPQGCTAFLGGISKNYDNNLLININSSFMVAEADEFDRSFLKLFPALAVITSTDADHLDIYTDHDSLLNSFAEFTQNIDKNGTLLLKSGINLPYKSGVKTYSYAISGEADFYANNLSLTNGQYTFDLVTPGEVITNITPGLQGYFNVENSIAACAAAWLIGVNASDISKSINSFKGVKRRFDHRVVTKELIYIDDYAHHPEELRACITAVKKLYPGKKLTGIFQPHLYTRTRDFAQGFAESLGLLDSLILLDIYPAREKPIKGVTSKMLLDLIKLESKTILSKDEAVEFVKLNKPEVLLTLGAGDIDQLVPRLERLQY